MFQQCADVATRLRELPAEYFYFFRLCCWILGQLRCLRHKDETETPTSCLSHSPTTQSNHSPPFVMCLPRFWGSFSCVLESLVSPTNATSKLALAERFTSKRCQRNALPSHLNGNVSQSLQPFSSNTTYLFSPINSFSHSSSSPPSST